MKAFESAYCSLRQTGVTSKIIVAKESFCLCGGHIVFERADFLGLESVNIRDLYTLRFSKFLSTNINNINLLYNEISSRIDSVLSIHLLI